VRPLYEILKVTEKVAQGDLTAKVSYVSRDEIGQLAKSFNKMTKQLEDLIGKVSETSNRVSSETGKFTKDVEHTTQGAIQISRMVQEIASGSDIQVKETEESAQVLEEMTNGIQSVAEAASDVSEMSFQAKNQAIKGRESIQLGKQQMDKIHHVTQQAVEEINSLHRNSEEIGQIIEVITDIANQTNLLSLNAEIEAARAGEHGKGFAVVAGEVRKLAEQSESSADKIVRLIRGIQEQTTRTAKVMDEGAKEVQKGTATVNEADTSFEKIVEVIETVADKTQDVSAAVQEMSASSQQIVVSSEQTAEIAKKSVENVNNVAATTEDQQTAMERVSEYAKSLKRSAEELNQSIRQFQVR
jgi:methyl-accepting chemotaxis protein